MPLRKFGIPRNSRLAPIAAPIAAPLAPAAADSNVISILVPMIFTSFTIFTFLVPLSARANTFAAPGFYETEIEITRPQRARLAPGTEVEPVGSVAAKIQYRVVTIDPKQIQISMVWKKPDGSPYALLRDIRDAVLLRGSRFLFATNAGMYDKKDRPLGLYIEGGKQLRPINRSHAPGGNFSMVPNGIFLLRGADGSLPEVIDSTEYKVAAGVQYATQSGPLLLRHGKIHPDFQPLSNNLKLRSGVGVNDKHQVVFAISQGTTSFYEFAQVFKKELRCDDALYLDGTISEFLVGPQIDTSQLVPFAAMITATFRVGKKTSH